MLMDNNSNFGTNLGQNIISYTGSNLANQPLMPNNNINTISERKVNKKFFWGGIVISVFLALSGLIIFLIFSNKLEDLNQKINKFEKQQESSFSETGFSPEFYENSNQMTKEIQNRNELGIESDNVNLYIKLEKSKGLYLLIASAIVMTVSLSYVLFYKIKHK